MRRINGGRKKKRREDEIRKNGKKMLIEIRKMKFRENRIGIFGEEMENVEKLDEERGKMDLRIKIGKIGLVVNLVSWRIRSSKESEGIGKMWVIEEISIRKRKGKVEIRKVEIEMDLEGLRKNDELMGKIEENRKSIRENRDGMKEKKRKSEKIRKENEIVRNFRELIIEVERIGIINKKLEWENEKKKRKKIIEEIKMDMIEIERKIIVGEKIGKENISKNLIVGREEENLKIMKVMNEKNLIEIGVIEEDLEKKVRRMDSRNKDLVRKRKVMLLKDDGEEIVKKIKKNRKKGIDERRMMKDNEWEKNKNVREDLRIIGILIKNGKKIKRKKNSKKR